MNYLENLLIYFSNLSTFYIFSVAISVAVVFLTIYIGMVTRFTIGSGDGGAADGRKSQQHQKTINGSGLSDGEEGSDDNEGSDDEDFRRIESVGQIKTAKLKSLENTLTDEQRQEEREIERKQLAAIFELLKKQNEEFSLGSNLDEEDLQEQLSLYR